MTSVLDLDNSSRLLIVVPHPDDETLATGGLIQAALAIGASLRVVIVTDGDNNPWPQRWIEKRWRIDSEARSRWGKRRRDEAAVALTRLGVAASDVRHYGWPDQGLTDLLMRDAQCEDQLVAEVLDFAPTLVAAPSLTDRHADHSALRVMLELAIHRTPFSHCRRLGFVVHGPLTLREGLTVPVSDEQVRKKQIALQAHASQLILSGKRMSEICRRVERFESTAGSSRVTTNSGQQEWRMADPRPPIPLHARALYLIVKIDRRVIRTSIPLQRGDGSSTRSIGLDGFNPIRVQVKKVGQELYAGFPCEQAIDQIFAKIERLGSRVFIYDPIGWQQMI